MTDKITFGMKITIFVLALVVGLSIGTFAFVVTSMNYTDLQTEQTLIELKAEHEQIWKQFEKNAKGLATRDGALVGFISVQDEKLIQLKEQLQILQAQVTEQQAATKTLSKNQIDIPETTETKKSFYLIVTDVTQNPKDTFTLNEIAYFTGKADDTADRSITYKILSPPPFPVQLYTSDIPIPNEGNFPMHWIIPTNAASGTYTLQVSDGDFTDSITFKVE